MRDWHNGYGYLKDEPMNHSDLVRALKKPGDNIAANLFIQSSLIPNKADAIHMVMGISGEAGELLDAIKKWTIYNKELDRENVIEELGDLEFFMEGLRQCLGITREETIAHNTAKLSRRYATMSYSDEQAQNRADKE